MEVSQIRTQCVYQEIEGVPTSWANPTPFATCLSPPECLFTVRGAERSARDPISAGLSVQAELPNSALRGDGWASLLPQRASLSASGKQVL